MKIVTIGLATLLAFCSTAAFARGGGHERSCNSSASPCRITSPPSPSNNQAGSAAAGANSVYNPSANSFINTSPSGSTQTEGTGAGGGQ